MKKGKDPDGKVRMLRFLTSIFIAATLITGCMPKKLPPVGPQTMLKNETIQSIFHPHGDDETIRAIAKIAVTGSRTSGSRRIALAVSPPQYLRLESLPVFGPPDFLLSLCDGVFKAYLPGAEKFYFGKATKEHLFSFFNIYLSPREITSVLTGVPPLSPEDGTSVAEYRDAEEHRIDLLKENQILQSVWINVDVRMSRLEVFEETNGKLLYSALFADYSSRNRDAYPQRITLDIRKPEPVHFDIRYKDMTVSYGEDPAFFDLRIPPGISPIHIK